MKIGVSTFLCFVVEREERTPKNDNWNFWIWVFFGSKHGRFVTVNCFCFLAEVPIFIVFWGCVRFGPSCQKMFFGQNKNTEKFD